MSKKTFRSQILERESFAPDQRLKFSRASSRSKVGRYPRTASAMASYIPEVAWAKLSSRELAELMDGLYQACNDAKRLAGDEA